MYETVYLGLDAHTRNCVLAVMDSDGQLIKFNEFKTSEAGLIRHIMYTEIQIAERQLAWRTYILFQMVQSTVRIFRWVLSRAWIGLSVRSSEAS